MKCMTVNQQIAEALGKCWHEHDLPPSELCSDLVCIICGKLRTEPAGTDYLNDPAACVELLGDDRLFDARINKMRARVEYFEPSGACKNVTAPTFCEAICKAYLKSQGITPEGE